MPMARQKSSDGLAIELSDNRKYYTVGSKVSGSVTLNTAQDFAIGSVNLEFYGRVKGMFRIVLGVSTTLVLTQDLSTLCSEPRTRGKSLARSSTTLLELNTSV
jgi:hypothetical protein